MEILFYNYNFFQQYFIIFKNSLVVFEMHPSKVTQPMTIKEIKADIEKQIEKSNSDILKINFGHFKNN
jgi:hypothetical protein